MALKGIVVASKMPAITATVFQELNVHFVDRTLVQAAFFCDGGRKRNSSCVGSVGSRSRALILALLLMGGIESNPGPDPDARCLGKDEETIIKAVQIVDIVQQSKVEVRFREFLLSFEAFNNSTISCSAF